MQVSQSLWKHTKIGKALTIFPGEINEMLQHAQPAEIVRAQEAMPVILWRWHYLQQAQAKGVSPYLYLDWRREIEHWPTNGQFYPSAKLKLTSNAHQKPLLNIDITADYLGFFEQPLLTDFVRIAAHQQPVYNFSQIYATSIKALLATFPGEDITEKFVEANMMEIINRHISLCLFTWYYHDKIINQALSYDQWFQFWKDIFKQVFINQHEGYGTDTIQEALVIQVRQKIPEYSYLQTEVEQAAKSGKQKRIRQWAQFWVDCGQLLVYPLSWALPILAPYFVSRENFAADVQEVLQHYHPDAAPLFGPASAWYLTPLGIQFFTHSQLTQTAVH